MFISKILSVILTVIMLPLSVLTSGIDLFGAPGYSEETKTNVAGIGAYFHSQGIATDGETFYFSSKTTIIRTESDYITPVNANYSAIPDELKDNYGIAHIGGMSYYNGYIYAGLEDSKVWDYPIVGVYDAETLELVDYYIMDAEVITRGLPWVCVDPESGYLYCTDHSKTPTKILVYDTANEMAFVGEIPLEVSIPSIQGAEFYNGTLYAATNDDTQAIYKINVSTGESEKYIDRNLILFSEGEGLTVTVKDGKPYLVAIDLGAIFVNTLVREYAIA